MTMGNPTAPPTVHSPWPGLLRGTAASAICLVALLAMMVDLNLSPQALASGSSKLGRFMASMVPPSDGGDSIRILKSLAETFAMAVAGTALAIVAAVPLGLIGAKTVVSNGLLHFVFRRCLDIFRGVPALVWALIFISAFGLGPFAGVIALAFADIPNLAKLFAETLENCDRGPVEGARASGVSKILEIRFGLAPQVAPVMASQCLYYSRATSGTPRFWGSSAPGHWVRTGRADPDIRLRSGRLYRPALYGLRRSPRLCFATAPRTIGLSLPQIPYLSPRSCLVRHDGVTAAS